METNNMIPFSGVNTPEAIAETSSNSTTLSKNMSKNEIINRSFDIFKDFLNSTIGQEGREDDMVNADEEFIKNEIQKRLAAPDVTIDERLQLLNYYTTLTSQKGQRANCKKSENTKRIAIAGAATLLFGFGAVALSDNKNSMA